MFCLFVDVQYNHDFVLLINVNIFFLFDTLVRLTNFNKLQPTFKGVLDNTELTLWEERWWKSEEICYFSYWWASDPFLPMMTSSNGNIFRVTGHLCGEFTGPGEFPTQRPVTRSFDVFSILRLNKRLS